MDPNGGQRASAALMPTSLYLSGPNIHATKKAVIIFHVCTMNLTGSFVVWLAIISDHVWAFMLPLQTSSHQQLYIEVGGNNIRPTAALTALIRARPAFPSVLRAEEEEAEATVFDAGGSVSWADYKKQKPNEFKLNEGDEKQCWKTDECPVEDERKFTKAWHIRSAERIPTTETHFDSEGEWEEENKDAWSKKWYENVGEDDLHEEPATALPKTSDSYDI